jgi:hypothetical protein
MAQFSILEVQAQSGFRPFIRTCFLRFRYSIDSTQSSGQRTQPAPTAFIVVVRTQPNEPNDDAIWKAATWLVIEHGDNAPTLVADMVNVLERMHVNEDVTASWREIGEAVRELLDVGVKP